MQERGWRNVELKRRPFIVSGKKQDDEAARLGEKGIGAGGGKERRSWPWRITTDVPRALLDTVVAGVGYLLSVVGAPDRKIYMLISLQHVGGDDHERRLLPFCPRWHISGQPNVWTLRGPLCTIATSTADSCHGDMRRVTSRHLDSNCRSDTIPATVYEIAVQDDVAQGYWARIWYLAMLIPGEQTMSAFLLYGEPECWPRRSRFAFTV